MGNFNRGFKSIAILLASSGGGVLPSLLLCSCALFGQGNSTQIGLGVSLEYRPAAGVFVSRFDFYGFQSSTPVGFGDEIIAVNNRPVYMPQALNDPAFCTPQQRFLMYRPSAHAYFTSTTIRRLSRTCMPFVVMQAQVIRPVFVVTQVVPDSPAFKAGLAAGDVLLEAFGASFVPLQERTLISSLEGMERAMAQFHRLPVMFLRNGNAYRTQIVVNTTPALQGQGTLTASARPSAPSIQETAPQKAPTEIQNSPQASSRPQSAQLHHASLTIANQTPFVVISAVHMQLSPEESRTEGWFTLSPGEIKDFAYDFQIEPNFQVFSESRAPEAIRWLHKNSNPEATFYFGGAEDTVATHHLISYEKMSFNESSEVLSNPPPNMELVSFLEVPRSPGQQFIHVLYDPLLPSLIDTSGLSLTQGEELKLISSRALKFASSIDRQRKFQAKFRSREDVPFLLDADIRDTNGPNEAGVVVTSVLPKTIFDDPPLFQPGDIITGLGGSNGEIETVYSYEDVGWLLFQHGTDIHKGIAVPIKVRLIRGNSVLTGITTYRFNLGCIECWPANELSEFKAFAGGALDAIMLGAGSWAELILTDLYKFITDEPIDVTRDHFDIVQHNARLREFAPRAVEWGQWAGFFSFLPSAPRFIAERVLAGTVLEEGATAVLTRAAIDVAEGATWTVLSASPLRTKNEIIDEAKRGVPYNAGLGLAMGTWTHVHHKSSVIKEPTHE